jgi:hypothetical protein
MLRFADARSGILFPLALFIAGIVAALPWLIPWVAFADLGGWPSNDDPFYAKPLALWTEGGPWQWVRQHGELTASSVAHVLTGVLATAGGVFSYRNLFLIVILQQALGVVFLFWFSRRLDLPLRFALGLAATLACFPLYYGHAFTFMTDGPAAAWAAIACTMGIWGVVKRDWRWLLASSVAVGWGYWIRQTNGLILLAPLVSLWLVKSATAATGPSRRGHWCLILCLAVPAATAFLAFEWGGWLPGSVARAEDVAPKFSDDYWRKALIAAYGWLLICGWFGLPWLVALIHEAKKASGELSPKARRVCRWGAAFAGVLALLPWLATSGRAALTSATGNFIQNAHFGPIFLSDMDEPSRWGSLNGVEWPFWIWQSLSLLSLVTVAAMAWWAMWTFCQASAVFSNRRKGHDASAESEGRSDAPPAGHHADNDALAFGALACLAVLGLGAFAIVFLIEPHMDRYWLFLLPVLAVWWVLLAALRRWRLGSAAFAWAGIWVACHLAMSVVFTHDMLAWNNARWGWVNSRLGEGFQARQIDGGRDVNAWLRMDEDADTFPRAGDTTTWWSGFATWSVAVGPRPGWQVAERLPWKSWATGKTQELLVLTRMPGPLPGEKPVDSFQGPIP